jgi:preprotein translocase subunit SecG
MRGALPYTCCYAFMMFTDAETTLEKIILILVRAFFVNFVYLRLAVLKAENAVLVKNS